MTQKISYFFGIFSLLFLTVLLQAGCNTEDNSEKSKSLTMDNKSTKIIDKKAPATKETVEKPKLPSSSNKENKRINGYQTIGWEDLELPGKGVDSIYEKYSDKVEKTKEGSVEEIAILEDMKIGLNSLPVNPKWDKQKIRLPGFVSPLDINQEKGEVGDFLLVPYFGACIHVPPPPMNQTILVKPNKGKSINIEEIFQPVWVTGTIHVEAVTTDLAQAGYQIKNARLEIYEEK